MSIIKIDGFKVISKRTGRSFGTFRSRKAAVKRLRQIEFFKHKKR